MKKFFQYTGAVLWIVIIIAILTVISDDETGPKIKPPEKTEQAGSGPAPSDKPEPKFKDFKIVKEEDISTALRSRFKIEVEAPNADTDRKAIEPLIEQMAKYTHEWTDGWLGAKFDRFGWDDRKAGTLAYLGNKIRFQNVFGAWQNMGYRCSCNPTTKTAEVEVY